MNIFKLIAGLFVSRKPDVSVSLRNASNVASANHEKDKVVINLEGFNYDFESDFIQEVLGLIDNRKEIKIQREDPSGIEENFIQLGMKHGENDGEVLIDLMGNDFFATEDVFLPLVAGFLSEGLTVLVDLSTLTKIPAEVRAYSVASDDGPVDPDFVFSRSSLETLRMQKGIDIEVIKQTVRRIPSYLSPSNKVKVDTYYVFKLKED